MTPRAITLFPRGAGGVPDTLLFARAVKAGGACLMVSATDMCLTWPFQVPTRAVLHPRPSISGQVVACIVQYRQYDMAISWYYA